MEGVRWRALTAKGRSGWLAGVGAAQRARTPRSVLVIIRAGLRSGKTRVEKGECRHAVGVARSCWRMTGKRHAYTSLEAKQERVQGGVTRLL